MQARLPQLLTDAISEVLETMCFQCPVPLGPVIPYTPPAGDFIAARTVFGGPGHGRLTILFPKVLALALAGPLTEWTGRENGPGKSADLILEITNMAVGVFLRSVDTEAAVEATLPHLLENLEWDPSAIHVGIDVEGHLLQAELLWNLPVSARETA